MAKFNHFANVFFIAMTMPYFFTNVIPGSGEEILLPEETARHAVLVLRMKKGDPVLLTDGRGSLLHCTLSNDNKKNAAAIINNLETFPRPSKANTIAVSLVKNTGRLEWLLEKLTETGIRNIIPLLCERTEKQHMRQERLQGILISAMLQSRQVWLPALAEPTHFNELMSTNKNQKFIAHCGAYNAGKTLAAYSPFSDAIVLIGPEGDFSRDEIVMAIEHEFLPVMLGNNRLRTETAAMAAGVVMQLC
ncbi:MAG: RsmE family RNA methyltransferase [Ferruginibacter sp.]